MRDEKKGIEWQNRDLKGDEEVTSDFRVTGWRNGRRQMIGGDGEMTWTGAYLGMMYGGMWT